MKKQMITAKVAVAALVLTSGSPAWANTTNRKMENLIEGIMKKTRRVLSALMLLAAGWAKAGDVTLSPDWTFYNPCANSGLSNQTATSFDFYVRTNTGAGRPKVYQIFTPVNMSGIGAAFSVQFDAELLGWCQNPGAVGSWRLTIGDTNKNSELIGLVGIGQNDNRTDALKIRIDGTAFSLTNPVAAPLGVAGQSWNVRAMYPMPNGLVNNGNRLQQPAPGGGTHRFFMNAVRVSATELSVLVKWQIIADVGGDMHAGDGTELYVLRYDETTGFIGDLNANTPTDTQQSDAWGAGTATRATTDVTPQPAGSLNQLNFFGMTFEVNDPFGYSASNPLGNQDGGVRITNVRVGTENYFKPYTQITGLTRDPISGDVTIQWNSFQDSTTSGSKYNVTAVDNLEDFPTATPFIMGIPANSSGITTNIESSTTAPARFYRISLDPRPPGI